MFLLAYNPESAFHISGTGASFPSSIGPRTRSLPVAVDVSMSSTIEDGAVAVTDSRTSEDAPCKDELLIRKPTAKCGPKVSWPISKHKVKAYEDAVAMRDTRPCIILCRPFEDGNVGGTARAMLNFGLTDLRLVNPTADHESEKAFLRASGARQILNDAVIFDKTAPAVADLHLVFATTARLRENVQVYSPRESMELALSAIQRGERVGFLFGCEKNGLDKEEVDHAHALVHIPTCPGFSSLNLAQAVLLIAYEWGSASAMIAADTLSSMSGGRTKTDPDARAPLGQLDPFFTWWNSALSEAGFHADNTGRFASAVAKLRRLVMRGEPSKADLSVFWGALRQLLDYSKPSNNTQKQL